MSKTALVIQYNGSAYHGWQYQNPSTPTIQMCLENALKQIAGGEKIITHCAGRTDAGVHASAQVVHFEHETKRNNKAWIEGSNTLLPQDISVQWAREIDDSFHARFGAISRKYRYIIYNDRERPGLFASQLTWFKYPLDSEKMHLSAQGLLGENDFEAYRGSGCQSKSSFRNVSEISVYRRNNFVYIDISANAFLLHMVRNIVGVLLEVGQDKKTIDWPLAVLESKNRAEAGVTAPASGLHLIQILYPDVYQIPSFPGPYIQFG